MCTTVVQQLMLKKKLKHSHGSWRQNNKEDVFTTYCPELDEVLHHSGTNHRAVDGGVGQEQDKVLVVGEANAVVHPGWSEQQQMFFLLLL